MSKCVFNISKSVSLYSKLFELTYLHSWNYIKVSLARDSNLFSEYVELIHFCDFTENMREIYSPHYDICFRL